MKISWTQGLEKEKMNDVISNFNDSVVIRKRLVELLLNKQVASQKKCCSENLYNSPQWAYIQADSRGFERALNEVIELII